MDTQVSPITLPVEIVARQFRLLFLDVADSPVSRVRVFAGASTSVAVVLLSEASSLGSPSLVTGETLMLRLAYSDGTGVRLSSSMPRFSAGSTKVRVTLSAMLDATSGTLTVVAELVNVVVESAPLPVEILPRAFALSFTTLVDAPLAPMARVQAGGSTEVMLMLNGAEELLDGESVQVSLAATVGQEATVLELRLTKRAPSMPVVISATYDAAPPLGVVVASGEVRSGGNVVMGRRVLPSTLPVEILARPFRLVFLDVADSPVSRVRVSEGASTEVVVLLREVSSPGLPSLAEDERLLVGLAYSDGTGVGLSLSTVEFSVGKSEASVTLSVAFAATPGTLTAMVVAKPVDIAVEPALLPVEILPREFALSFRILPSMPLATMARVLAGGSTEVAVLLENPGQLRAGESMRVSLTADAITVVPDELRLSAQTPHASFSIDAAYDAVPFGTVMASGAVRSGGAVVVNTRVLPTTLPVEVVARRFRIELSTAEDAYTRSPGFKIPDDTRTQSVRSTITVVEGDPPVGSFWVAVSITHKFRSDLIVGLVPPGGDAPLMLHERSGGSNSDLREIYTSQDDPLDSLLGEPTPGDWVLTVGDYRVGVSGTLDAWGIGFGPSARVVAGVSKVLAARLVEVETALGIPRLFSGEEVKGWVARLCLQRRGGHDAAVHVHAGKHGSRRDIDGVGGVDAGGVVCHGERVGEHGA